MVGLIGGGEKLIGDVYLLHGVDEVLGEGRLEEDLLFHQEVYVILHNLHDRRVSNRNLLRN